MNTELIKLLLALAPIIPEVFSDLEKEYNNIKSNDTPTEKGKLLLEEIVSIAQLIIKVM